MRYAARWKVKPDDFEERMAEVHNGAGKSTSPNHYQHKENPAQECVA
jgi:hypothetical protein